eukprot:GFYU01016857.1.p1 GENE.GFYU01016857.1~~GFYU01016857.1.p1  ORF type:complete len:494 (-),score=118.76 GFYU01016857.1:53-1468(-)
MSGEKVPTYSSLKEIYGDAASAVEQRYADMEAKFVSQYGSKPTFYARAPGRVNLIGEHVDYCGYGVLPMAIANDVIIACTPTDSDDVNIHHLEDKYTAKTINKNNIDINPQAHHWTNYALCGLKGVIETANITSPKGMNVVVHGTVPSGAGLSSSSALVCAFALASAAANGLQMEKLAIADLCARCEKYVGTQSGGMDQAISFLAGVNVAKQIDFNPLRCTDVQLPNGVAFVIANSAVESLKQVTAATNYNRRVLECRLGAMILSKTLNAGDWRTIRILGNVQKESKLTLADMVTKSKEILHDGTYTKQEITQVLGVSEQELAELTAVQDAFNAGDNFPLQNRAVHVFGEAQRTYEFAQVCSRESSDPAATMKTLGDLMNDSHFSCSEKYECSCEELDRLTKMCRDAGALGSRLTGAGWGGCTVSLVPEGIVSTFIDTIRKQYYTEKHANDLETLCFASKPMAGAAVYQPA